MNVKNPYVHHLWLLRGLCFACFLISAIEVEAQDDRIARQHFSEGNYFAAIDMYTKLVKRSPNELEYNLNLGISYLRTRIDPKRSLDYMLKAATLPKFPGKGLLSLAEAYTHHLQYEKAIETLEKYREDGHVNRKTKADFEKRMADYRMAVELLRYPVEVEFQNLGPNINSPYPDYHPFVDKEENTLVFTSRRKMRPGSSPEFDGYFPSNIFTAQRIGEDWEQATKLSDRINTPYDEQAVGLTDSGDSLFFYVDHINSFGNIYLSVRESRLFGPPTSLDDIVNSDYIESACSISRDANTLFFSSDRPGGYGGLDIWMRRKLPNGEWGQPYNLGPEINTPFDEDFPTLSGDGETLYFCSNGHPGMGNFDLFFAGWDRRENVWSTPQNLGFPVNTPADEKSISFNDSGDRAYITALRDDSFGDLDIYEITYTKLQETLPAVFLISVPEMQDQSPVQKSEIRIHNEDKKLIGTYAANRFNNTFVIALYPGKYHLELEVDGYQPIADVMVVNYSHVRQEVNPKTITLKK